MLDRNSDQRRIYDNSSLQLRLNDITGCARRAHKMLEQIKRYPHVEHTKHKMWPVYWILRLWNVLTWMRNLQQFYRQRGIDLAFLYSVYTRIYTNVSHLKCRYELIWRTRVRKPTNQRPRRRLMRSNIVSFSFPHYYTLVVHEYSMLSQLKSY